MNPIHLIAFPGAPNLPLFAAIEQGLFEAEGVEVHLQTTPSSAYQAERIVSGECQIAATAFDNVVAYREGQGAVAFDPPLDLVAFMGATRVELSLVVAPEIESHRDLAGRSLALDALATGFAFVLYHMLERGGLGPDDYERVPVGATPQRWASVRDGEHAGTLTIEPFTSLAAAQGFRVLDSSRTALDACQGGVFAARRDFAMSRPESVEGFIRGYLAGLAWTLDADNHDAAASTLLRNMPALRPEVVDRVLAGLTSPETGLTPRGAIDERGVREVLALRSKYGPGDRALTDPDRYIDLSWYRRAVG